MQAKRIVFISLSVLILVATILTTLLITEKKHKENILNVYNECCQEVQEALYNYLNTDNESCYEQLCDNVFAMTNIALILKKANSLRQLNNDLQKSYAYLIEAPDESIHYLDFLNEALMAWANEKNIELFQIRLQSFNNRVQQELNGK